MKRGAEAEELMAEEAGGGLQTGTVPRNRFSQPAGKAIIFAPHAHPSHRGTSAAEQASRCPFAGLAWVSHMSQLPAPFMTHDGSVRICPSVCVVFLICLLFPRSFSV